MNLANNLDKLIECGKRVEIYRQIGRKHIQAYREISSKHIEIYR